MDESCRKIYQTRPQVLAEMLAVESSPLMPWRADELGLIFEHQLKAPVVDDLEVLSPPFAERLRAIGKAEKHSFGSFGELFQEPGVSLEVLSILQEFTEAQLAQPDSLMPPEFAKVLRLACAVQAWRLHGQLLATLTPQSLLDGLNWAIGLPWLARPMREMFLRGVHELGRAQPSVAGAFQPAAG